MNINDRLINEVLGSIFNKTKRRYIITDQNISNSTKSLILYGKSFSDKEGAIRYLIKILSIDININKGINKKFSHVLNQKKYFTS